MSDWSGTPQRGNPREEHSPGSLAGVNSKRDPVAFEPRHAQANKDTHDAIVNKVWNFCHTLGDDGLGYGDYLEQLTYLLFLKMADEYSKKPYNRDTKVPTGFDWQSLRGKSGAELESHYVKLLDELGKKTGMLGDIFVKAQNKISDPAKLHKLIQLIDGESWERPASAGRY